MKRLITNRRPVGLTAMLLSLSLSLGGLGILLCSPAALAAKTAQAAKKGHAAKKKKKKKPSTQRGATGPAGPMGLPGLKGTPGAPGAQGPIGPIGPMGPGATKFFYDAQPAAVDSEHPVLTVGPLQLAASCEVGAAPGDIKFTYFITIPVGPLEDISTAFGEKGTTVQTIIVPAATNAPISQNVPKAGPAYTSSGDLMLQAPGSGPVYLRIAYGADPTAAVPHCFMAGYEL
jgi:hypothetical protein